MRQKDSGVEKKQELKSWEFAKEVDHLKEMLGIFLCPVWFMCSSSNVRYNYQFNYAM